MSFLAPLMLLGLVLAAAPIWIHLFGAKRARKVDFAAVDFLLGTDRKVSRSLRLRELLLLIARVLLFLLVPLLVAKPFASCSSRGPQVERGPQGAVLIIDNGLSSRFRIGDETLLDRSRLKARRVLDDLGPEADAQVLLTSERDSPDELSRDHLRLRDRLSDARSAADAGDALAALARAQQLLTSSPHQRNTVYLFTARAAASFSSGTTPWPPGSGPKLVVVDVADDDDLNNLAITGLEVSPDPAAGPRGLRVDAEIRNFGKTPSGQLEARLTIGGEILARATISLGPGDAISERFSASLPAGVRTANVAVEIDDDALALDNRRYLVAHLRENVRVLLVNGDPRTVRNEDELFYLKTALGPSGSGATLVEITADQLGDAQLGDVDVVVLANVPASGREQADRLTDFVSSGGGLLIGVGDNVEPEAYNRNLSRLLPQQLASIFDAGYGSQGAKRQATALRLAKLDAEHSVLKLFGPDGLGLKDAAFTKVALLGPTTEIASRRVLARYQSGAAALVEGAVGQGRVLLLTSSLDRDWSDLVIQTGFLPLVDAAVRYLAKKQLRAGKGDVLSGQPALVSVEPRDRRLEVLGPAGRAKVLEGERLSGREVVRFDFTARPGFYSVLAEEASGKRLDRPESGFAVNVDAELSSLQRIEASELPVSGPGTQADRGDRKRRVELWHALGAILLLLLTIEGLLVLRN